MFDTLSIDIQELDIIVPYNIEIIWGIGRPKSGCIKTMIIRAFYYPPRAKKKQKVIDHMIITMHSLLWTYPDAEIVIAGDRNDLDLTPVRNKVPNLRLVSTGPTHKSKQLDVILYLLVL